MKKLLIAILSLILALSLCVGCGQKDPAESSTPDAAPSGSPIGCTPASPTDESTPAGSSESTPGSESLPDAGGESTPDASGESTPGGESSTTDGTGGTQPPESTPTEVDGLLLDGVAIEEYTIVYGSGSLDYTVRAAEYIRDQILARTGVELEIARDNAGKGTFAHEIVVGEANRAISDKLDADTEGVQFALLSDGGHIALEGDYFVIAAAAYYFVETYVGDGEGRVDVPDTVTVCEPITEKPENFIFLIGDGMGLYQTLLFDIMNATEKTDYSDGEDFFYGYLFPYMGLARTNSLSGLTDSAAAGTALATGYKTINGYIGRDRNLKDLKSLTEIAASIGKATAVMSTEPQTGATPASFSAHANNRNDSSVITASQNTLMSTYGTLINCNFDVYTNFAMRGLENKITGTLDALSADEDGFFIMYEEAYIDKHCHNNDINKTFQAVVRFNQAIGLFMEYAFYNPDTFVLITADHETGGLLPNNSGGYSYSHGNHSPHYVPVFTYGEGGELFDGIVIENIQIPKTIASFWGETIVGDDGGKFPALTK